MLTDSYFAELDDAPPPGRLELLPQWAMVYERGLRRLANWWSDHKRITHHGNYPRFDRPKLDRLASLPRWAQAWIRTLEFEVWWQRHLADPAPVPFPLLAEKRATLHSGRSLFGSPRVRAVPHSLPSQLDDV